MRHIIFIHPHFVSSISLLSLKYTKVVFYPHTTFSALPPILLDLRMCSNL